MPPELKHGKIGLGLSETPMCDHERIIEVAAHHFSGRENIPDTLLELKVHPDILKIQMDEFDSVICTLNLLLASKDLDSRLKNIADVRNKFKEVPVFPALASLREEKGFGTYFAVHASAIELNALMEAGEKGELYRGKSIYFHKEITDPGVLTTACLIEGYGQFAQKLESAIEVTRYGSLGQNLKKVGITREEFVRVFEEALGFTHRDTHLFKNVQTWYTEEEGFSQEFLELVKSG